MKTFFVVNGASGNGATGKSWSGLQARIGSVLPDNGHAFTEGPMHAAELARGALRQGYQCVVAVGGDGTLNEVTNGFFEGGQPVAPQAALAVLPRGTGGDFRRTFGWELDVEATLRRIAGGESRPFDVGEVEFLGHDGRRQRRYFANICSFGVSGAVAQKANQTTKAFGGRLSFMMASLKALAGYQDRAVRFRVDGGPAQEARVTTLAVCNGKYFGGGMKVAPEADTGDGRLDVTVWSGYGLSDFVFKQGGIYRGEHVTWPGTRQLTCRTLEAESDEEVLIDCDGEQPGKLPCKMTVLPGALRLRA